MELIKDYESDSDFSSSGEPATQSKTDKPSPKKQILEINAVKLNKINDVLGMDSQLVAIRKR